MGLDQHAGWIKNNESSTDDNKVVPINQENDEVLEFTWRKHARLQQFMMELWYKRQGVEPAPVGMMDSFNCENLYLEEQDIHDLQQKILDENLPFCPDGFFWGHQFQEESMAEYKLQDLDFCNRARKWLKEGKRVWYFCSW